MFVERLPDPVSDFTRADAFVRQLGLSAGEEEVRFANGRHASADLTARIHDARIGWNLEMEEEEGEEERGSRRRRGMRRESKHKRKQFELKESEVTKE